MRHHASRGVADAGNRGQEFDGGSKGLLIGPRLHFADRSFEVLELLQLHLEHETVMLGDPALERVLERGPRGSEAPTGQIDEAVQISLPRDQRSQDGATAGTDDVRDGPGQLDVGVFQSLLDALCVAGDLAYKLLARACQGAKLLDVLGWHEAATQESVGQRHVRAASANQSAISLRSRVLVPNVRTA